MGFTSRLAQFVLENNSFDHLPADVVERSKEMMVNAAAAALASAAQPEAQTVTRFVQEMQGNGKCTIIGMGLRTSPVYAALANGLMVHLLDFDDDIILRGACPSSTVFPVVMALGEMNGCAGKDVLAAYILGCEVTSKLAGLGLGSLEYLEKGMVQVPEEHCDGGFDVIGAAVAAGSLLRLDLAQMESALGIACGAAAGIYAGLDRMEKMLGIATPGHDTSARALQYGQAAMNGLMAAILAQQGFRGRRDALEAPDGVVYPKLSPDGRIEEDFFNRLANPYDVVHPGVTLKLYPCSSASHTAIDAVLQLVQQYRIGPDQVESVRVNVTPETLELLPFLTPQNGWEARFCLSYIVAATLLHGQPLIDFFSDAAVQDEAVRQMMDRVTVEASETPSVLTSSPSSIELTLTDGRRLQHRAEFARGQPELPLDTQELDAKFLYCTRYILPPDHIEEAIDSFRNLENIENVTGMVSVLGG
jgi:2-methylcitrate dehydratase PrpD